VTDNPGPAPEHRGHQVGLDKGYQPTTEVAQSQPPTVGSATVQPTSGTNNTAQSTTETDK
jgi:hypothetical protein